MLGKGSKDSRKGRNYAGAVRGPGGFEDIKTVIKTRIPFLVPPLKLARSVMRVTSRMAGAVARRLPIIRSWRSDLLRIRRRAVFNDIYRHNRWLGVTSRSGIGSELEHTARLRQNLSGLLQAYGIRSMLDIPCGDFHWMSHLQLDVDYVGADIVPELVERNQKAFAGERRRFARIDMVDSDLPASDLILCRDGLVHLSNEEALLAIERFKQSGALYLMATTFVDLEANQDIASGQWRPLNMTLPPFRFPAPLTVLLERDATDEYPDKSVALWRMSDLP
jgi:hypothetical protein